MDLLKLISELRAERDRVDKAIIALESVNLGNDVPAKPPERRGRRHMSAEERKTVSERMRSYWAAKRKSKAAAAKPTS